MALKVAQIERFGGLQSCLNCIVLLSDALREGDARDGVARVVLAPPGPRALALWFSRPDEDNWFSFDAITALCEKLCERRGQHLALVGGVCTRDALPLVVDATEGLITAFTLALAD